MCGRAKLEGDISQIKIAFRVPPDYPTPNFAPSWNVAPTDSLPIVRYNPKAGHRTLDLMRWGLVPYWARDHRDRLLDHQRDGRDGGHKTSIPRSV
jgi:putative SOS response-associated peptidase YedK